MLTDYLVAAGVGHLGVGHLGDKSALPDIVHTLAAVHIDRVDVGHTWVEHYHMVGVGKVQHPLLVLHSTT